VHPIRAEHVRHFVRVGDDGRRPERQHESGELVDEQLRRLEVHVRIDEARHDPATGGVELLFALVVAQAGHVAVRDGHVHVEPLAGEDREDTAAADDEICWLVPTGYGEAPGEVGHTRQRTTLGAVEVLTPRSLDEALRQKSERPEARPIAGGTDLMVDLNFDRLRPETLLNLNEVPELRGWERENGTLKLGAGLTYAEAMQPGLAELLPALAEASRTVGSPQIRNRGTIGGNLGTASPAGDALPPLLVEAAEVELASVRGFRSLPLPEFLVGPKQNALEPDELVTAVRVSASGAPQTFMKVGPRNAMVIAVVSLAVLVDRDGGELRASFGSAGPVAGLVTAPLDEQESFPERVAAAASPIDDVRGTAAYRRHALRVLTARALERCLA
jgi:CO/xanthine dehydrogenase FAD-binding subunit